MCPCASRSYIIVNAQDFVASFFVVCIPLHMPAVFCSRPPHTQCHVPGIVSLAHTVKALLLVVQAERNRVVVVFKAADIPGAARLRCMRKPPVRTRAPTPKPGPEPVPDVDADAAL